MYCGGVWVICGSTRKCDADCLLGVSERVAQRRARRRSRGASLVEYLALLCLIVLAVLAALQAFGHSARLKYDQKTEDVMNL